MHKVTALFTPHFELSKNEVQGITREKITGAIRYNIFVEEYIHITL
jgi:hypothetical protein